MRNEKDQIKRVKVKFRPLVDYMELTGKTYETMSVEELKPFEGEPEDFPNSQMPMRKKQKCFICNKKTCWLDKIHGLYMCSEKCQNIIDERYNNGENFEPHLIYKEMCNNFIDEFEIEGNLKKDKGK